MQHLQKTRGGPHMLTRFPITESVLRSIAAKDLSCTSWHSHSWLSSCTSHRSQITSRLSLSTFDFQLSTSYPSGRTVAFPLHSTSLPLWNAPPSRTIEGQSEARFASQAWPLAEGSLNMSTVLQSPFKTSWVH